MDPLHPCWWLANGLHTAFPHLRFPLTSLALPPGFPLGSRLTQEGFLMGDAQHLATGRFDRQHALQQEAVVGAIADGTQPAGRGMLLIVHFGRVLDQQHSLRLAHLCSRLLEMRADQLLIADLRRLQEAVGRVRLRLASHLLGQGGGWINCYGRCHRHRSLLSTPMTQADLPKGLFRPLLGRQQGARLHHAQPFFRLNSSLMDSITSVHLKLWLTVRWTARVTPPLPRISPPSPCRRLAPVLRWCCQPFADPLRSPLRGGLWGLLSIITCIGH